MNEQAKRQNILIDKAIPSFRRDIAREKNRFIEQQSKILYSRPIISDVDMDEHRINMELIFQKHYSRIIRVFFLETERAIPRKNHFDMETKFSAWDFMLLAWINLRGGQAAQQTSATTRDDIIAALNSAIQTTEAVTQDYVAASILKVKGFSVWRANTIARTELGMASSYAQQETAKKISSETGIQLKKQWIPVRDERTRIDHGVMAGSKPIGMDEKFVVGGERLDRPRDPVGSAGTIINCRCAMIHVMA